MAADKYWERVSFHQGCGPWYVDHAPVQSHIVKIIQTTQIELNGSQRGEKNKQSTLTWMRREECMDLGGDEGGGEYGQNTWYKFFKELNKINIKIKGIRRLK